jgi:hypothetical protein
MASGNQSRQEGQTDGSFNNLTTKTCIAKLAFKHREAQLRRFSLVTLFALTTSMLAPVSAANAFDISFEWGNIPLCTSGRPNTVANPTFNLRNVPAGTTQIQFKLVDKDVPDFNHGGALVPYAGGNTVPNGAFRYKSPCPPNGKHTYEWTARAADSNGKILGNASAKRQYPE